MLGLRTRDGIGQRLPAGAKIGPDRPMGRRFTKTFAPAFGERKDSARAWFLCP